MTTTEYRKQSEETLPFYLEEHCEDVMKALDASSAQDLECMEFGDGNLNLVFIVGNKKKPETIKVIVKQALPYVRCVGESWPLTLKRAYYEYRALSKENELCPEYTPKLYYFSEVDGLMIMQYIAPPAIILRKGLIAGIKYPTVARDIGLFLARNLFATSGLKLKTSQIREQVEFWSTNRDMCALTEQVIFTEPYIIADNNRWTSPQLDGDKAAIENDVSLKIAASFLKTKFVTQTQALLHADLHSGSIMAAPIDGATYMIDPEFAFYGPMGFDVGAIVANLFLSYVSQPGHRNSTDYAAWVLEQIVTLWETFHKEFISMWNDPQHNIGDLFMRSFFEDDDARADAQSQFMSSVFTDTLGFAGMKMLRRIVGIAHVEDLESIEDVDVRAACERHGLEIAKELIKHASNYTSIQEVVEMAVSKNQ